MKKSWISCGFWLVIIVALGIQVLNDPAKLLPIAGQKEGNKEQLVASMGKPCVYLTFDDGPTSNTDKILKILKRNKVKATFFVIGKKGKIPRRRYRAIVRQGHTLGMHAYCHDYKKIYRGVGPFGKDIHRLERYLYQVTGIHPFAYRFPGGSSNRCTGDIKPYLRYVYRQGWKYYDWNADSGDALDFHVPWQRLNRRILQDVSGNKHSIVLMHDLYEAKGTVKGLEPLIRELKKRGYAILPIMPYTKEVHQVELREKRR